MNAPEKVTNLMVAPGVMLIRPAPKINVQARRRAAAKLLKAMQVTSAKAKRTIRDLLNEVRYARHGF